jgi:hypothetical protein
VSLRKRWQDLDRATVARAPARWGAYELGDEDGDVVDTGHGVLRDELKDALAYADAARVRWETADSEAAARDLAEDL